MSDQSEQGPPSPPANSTESLPSPLEAIADMRAAARWTVGAVSIIGALLVGGGPLRAIGRIDGVGDFVTFAIGILLVILAAGWAVWQTGEALTPPLTTIETLQDKRLSGLRIELDRSPSTYFGPFGRNWRELAAELQRHHSIAANIRAAYTSETDPKQRARWADALTAAEKNIAHAVGLQNRLISIIHVWQIRWAVRRARIHTLIAMLVVAAGAMLVLVATTGSTISVALPGL